jgi:hypothetical protein
VIVAEPVQAADNVFFVAGPDVNWVLLHRGPVSQAVAAARSAA